MQLTKNFTLNEMTYSSTAEANNIDNRPSVAVVENLKRLCVNVLQPLREHYNCPVIISSGYRCVELNKKVGGARNSQHLLGEAADFIIPSKNLKDVFEWLRLNLEYDQLLYEYNSRCRWIHVSFHSGLNRRQCIDNYKA